MASIFMWCTSSTVPRAVAARSPPMAACSAPCSMRTTNKTCLAAAPGPELHTSRHSSSRYSALQAGGGDASPSTSTSSASPLEGERYLLTLDFGRERHTWMAQEWAASGRRVEVPLVVQLSGDGRVQILGIGAFARLSVVGGGWSYEQASSTLRLDLLLPEGLSRGDITLDPATQVFISVPAWGRQLSKDKGSLTIKQRRWLVRLESRLVGRLRAARLEKGEEVSEVLRPARMKAGNLEGPIYYS